MTVVEPWSDDPQVRENPALEGFLTVLHKEARRPVPPAVRYEHLAAVFEQAAAPAGPPRAPRRWAGRLAALTTSKVLLAGGVAAASTSGLAATGHLPAPVQRFAHDVAEHVGLDLPLPPDVADLVVAPPALGPAAAAQSDAHEVHAHTAPSDPGRSAEAPGRSSDGPGASGAHPQPDAPGATAADRGPGPTGEEAPTADIPVTDEADSGPDDTTTAPAADPTEPEPAPTETDPETADVPVEGDTATEDPADDTATEDPADVTTSDSPSPDDDVTGPPGPPASPGEPGRGNKDCQPRSGSDCSSDSVGANKSPASATRASTTAGSNRSSAPPSAAATTSSQSTGVETVGRGRARSE